MPNLVLPVIEPGGLARLGQPTLRVQELLIRPWQLADAAGVLSAYQNPEIQQWHVRTMAADEVADWLDSWSLRWAAETDATWAIADAGSLIGRVGFRSLDLATGSGEVTYWVLPTGRGRNIAARSLIAVTDWMFGQAGFHRLTLQHSTSNPASCRVAEKAGYGYEGTGRAQGLHADGWHDMHWHARLSD